MTGPLSGITVLDVTQQLVGPGGTMLLGDMGADVIHVEPPPADVPSYARDSQGRMRAGLSFLRSKRSISLDLTKNEARQVVYDLAEHADVFYQNYRYGVADDLGMDYAHIEQVNPSIVYCGVSAFGYTGPDEHRVGFDIIAQAGGGSMVPRHDSPDLPSPQGSPIGDVTGMCLGALGVVAALHHRRETGQGQEVNTSLLHSVTLNSILRLVAIEGEDQQWRDALIEGTREMTQSGATFAQTQEATATGIGGLPAARSQGAGGLGINVYYRSYTTADGFIAIGCLNLRQQQRLNAALELGDPRFEPAVDLESAEGQERAAAMLPRAEELFRSKTTEEWIEYLDSRSVACGRVLNTLELFDDPHHRANQTMIEYEDPWVGTVKTLGYPIRFDKTPMEMQLPAQPLGRQTDEILASIGRSPEEIAQLRQAGVAF
ncbi:MAG: CaiB/BaiF CoA-transferase family protein [Dehalococcoidia bacterium]|jgi:crotonobetainyl-CoA:carnitine CoA-transferase CaiB-like acyl-CoA transferase|nr:CaiB/BaiF CoA-transferase family protein [Dehalococcoidia bacterium]